MNIGIIFVILLLFAFIKNREKLQKNYTRTTKNYKTYKKTTEKLQKTTKRSLFTVFNIWAFLSGY